MNPFTLVIGASALFIAGCAAYFSVRGIALTFGAVSSFTIPIIIMASSLEIGKLVAASFLYRHWKTCNPTLRTYLLGAVVLLIGITSAGIYGYLSQAFEQTLSQVEGYEKEIVSLQRQQGEYDRLIQAYQNSGQKGSLLREEKQSEERTRLEKYIEERRKDIASAEDSKARLAEETDEMIVGERERREEEKKRLEKVIEVRRGDISKLEEQRRANKKEVDQRVAKEMQKEAEIMERIAQLDASVKIYQDKGPGGFLKEDGFKKAAELLKTQASEREGLRASLTEINAVAQKARDDLEKRYSSLDSRIEAIQAEITDANQKITGLTTGGAEQAGNVRTVLENLQQARASVDERIQSLESEIAEASRKITSMSEMSSVFGPDSSAELEEKKSGLQIKKEEAEQKILEIEGKIRATDIGSFKFVARAFDSEVAEAEATENPILIEEALTRAVNRVVKWFILILVLVFDPLAVTLVIAFNASLIRGSQGLNDEVSNELESPNKETQKKGNGLLVLLVGGLVLYGIYHILPDSKRETTSLQSSKASLISELSSRKTDDRALAYVPESAFGVISFSGLRMMEEVGLPKIISNDLQVRAPFIKDFAWDPSACGVQPNGRVLYFLQLPDQNFREERSGDVLFGLVFPISDESNLKEFILKQLDLKSENPLWRIRENQSPQFYSIHHKTAHISIGLDQNCLVLMSSWWSDQANPSFLDAEMEGVFSFGQGTTNMHTGLASQLRADDYDIGLFLHGENFFEKFTKTVGETELWNAFRDFLDFELSLKGEADAGSWAVVGEYNFKKEMIDAGFGLKVAGLLNEFREGASGSSLDGVFGEFVEIFLQRLDYQSVVGLLERIDLDHSTGFEGFDSLQTSSRVQNAKNASFSIQASSAEPGGASLRLAIDLLTEALSPFNDDASEE
tara:strand:- start:7637 stop:10372 length:2736 start_codon:yes stop_codon:yes gene_type:complete